MSITSALWISPRTHRHSRISRSLVWPCSWRWRHGDISDELLFYGSRDDLITPAAAQISSTSACVCTGCIFWPVKMVRVNGRTDLCVCVCVCVWTNRIPQAGRAVCVGEFCSCSFCVSESEPSAPAPGGHPQERPLPRWASWWACSHPPYSWAAGQGSSTQTQACACEKGNENMKDNRLHSNSWNVWR